MAKTFLPIISSWTSLDKAKKTAEMPEILITRVRVRRTHVYKGGEIPAFKIGEEIRKLRLAHAGTALPHVQHVNTEYSRSLLDITVVMH